MTIPDFFAAVMPERQGLITAIHELIMANDAAVTPVVKPLMGRAAIMYEDQGFMKYALADTKRYMSLHCMPMYMDPTLPPRFKALLPAAQFQKGCINFGSAAEMPPDALAVLINICTAVDIASILKNRKKK